MHLVGGLQPDMAIDARAGVPARLFLSIDMHYQSVLASYYYIRCQVEGKTGVTIHVVAEAMPIEPNGGTMIYAIKVDGDLLALSHSLLPFRREREILAVDALTAGEITSRTSNLWIEGQFDAPVMGDGDWTEILVARCLRGFRCGDFASRHLCLLRFRVIGYLRLFGGWLVEAQSRIRHAELSDYFGGISMTFAETESPTLVEGGTYAILVCCMGRSAANEKSQRENHHFLLHCFLYLLIGFYH